MTLLTVAQRDKPAREATLPRWRTIGAIAIAIAAWGGLRDWSAHHAFMINATDSLPNWAFFVDKGVVPLRRQYVFFRVPETPLVRVHFGEHPKAFGKLVYGIAGDIVSRAGMTVSVNGKPVATLKSLSKRGEALTPGPVGSVPDGCYFVATPHKDGFDSRYADIGWVCANQLVGTGVPVL